MNSNMRDHNFMLGEDYVVYSTSVAVCKSHVKLSVKYVRMMDGVVRSLDILDYFFDEEQGLIEFFNFVGANIETLTLYSRKSFCRINDILPMDSVTVIYNFAPSDEPFVFQLKSMRSLFWVVNLRGARISVHQDAVFPSLAPDILEIPPFKEWADKKREKIFNVVISTKKLGSFNIPFAKMLFEMI